MDPVLAIMGLAAIASWFQVLLSEKRKLKKKEQKTVDAFFEAVEQTQRYVRKTKPPRGFGKSRRNREQEFELSVLWAKASDYLAQIDWALAEKLSTKSAFWSNPDSKRWKTAHTELASIRLKDIEREARKLRRKFH